LEIEAEQLTQLLTSKGKSLKMIWRHRPDEIAIEFEGDDRTRLFVNRDGERLDISVT
jgi:hypothetical protein